MTATSKGLAAYRERAGRSWQAKTSANLYITVGMGTCGLAAGAEETLAAIEEELKRRGLNAVI